MATTTLTTLLFLLLALPQVHAFVSRRTVVGAAVSIGQEALSSSTALFKRKLNKTKRNRRSRTNDDSWGNGETIPANLRRKVEAKRPQLGHIVPKAVKQQGGSTNPKLRIQGKAREAGMNNPSRITIMGGVARRRRLDSPDVYLRPMMGKVKEAVFSTFTSFGLYEGDYCKHLDVFAGSGGVGLESLSRGATHCTFVDFSEDCCNAIRKNINWCQFGEPEEMTKVITADAIETLKDPFSHGIPIYQQYDIVTLCPPYEEVVYADLMEAAMNSPVVADDTIILVEYPVELGSLPPVFTRQDGTKLIGLRNRRYGRTVIGIYIVNPSGRLEHANPNSEEFLAYW